MKEIKLTKPRARYTITFKPDKDDDWFIYILHTDKNNKSTKKMIIQKDMDDFLNQLDIGGTGNERFGLRRFETVDDIVDFFSEDRDKPEDWRQRD
jgi:hypothetical protein